MVNFLNKSIFCCVKNRLNINYSNLNLFNQKIFTQFLKLRIIIFKKNFYKNKNLLNLVPQISLTFAMAANLVKEHEEILKKADALYDSNKLKELELLINKSEYLEKSELKAEFKWRLARCFYGQIKEKIKNEKEYEDTKNLVLSALEDNPECGPAYKWASILVDASAAYQGTKERIKQLLVVKKHMENAIKYNPTDPTSYYLLGEWNFSCYNVSWAERQIAKVVFGRLPDPDLEEALRMFQKAEQLEPCFYSKNLLLLAKTLFALKRDQDLAKQCLKKVVDNFKESKKWDDVEAVKEATSLLKNLGETV